MADKTREDRIRERAHIIWDREGQPQGAAQRHWEQAAAEIDADDDATGAPAPKKRAAAAKKAVVAKASPAMEAPLNAKTTLAAGVPKGRGKARK